jgi:hypothetical protein
MRQYPAAFLFLVLHLSNQNSEVNKNPKKCIYGAIRKETNHHLLSNISWAAKNSSGSFRFLMSRIGSKSSTEGLSIIEHARNSYTT